MEGKKIKEILLKGNYVSAEDLKKQAKSGRPVISYFITQGLLTNDLVGQAMAEHYKLSYADLNSNIPSKEQVIKIPEDVARKYRVVLFNIKPKEVVVTTDQPGKKELAGVLKNIFKTKKVKMAYSLTADIDAQFKHYRQTLDTRFAEIIKKNARFAPEIIDEIIRDAISLNASDVHFEPQEKEVIIRFRVDGVLQAAGTIPKEYYENILNRFKVLAALRIDEHFSAQDGAIRFVSDNVPVDIRLSIAPTLDGEKITLRLLSKYVRDFTLEDLGFSGKDKEFFELTSKKPFGMILTTGPTGSGKTTTLYSLLKTLNNPGVNITTIEDPVEYKIIGVNQIQVNKATDLTFAKGLRSIVRQDPDIVLVGEIRDEETAEIAVNAALTGHLLLSTFHSNDAATAIPRLLNMGIEPFLLASTLEVIVAQRLARKICEKCRTSYQLDLKHIDKHMQEILKKNKVEMYKGKGCPVCQQTGYKGRTAIFELIKVTPELKDLILENPSSRQIWELAKKQGTKSLFEDGLEKVKLGITTFEELMRVAPPMNNG